MTGKRKLALIIPTYLIANAYSFILGSYSISDTPGPLGLYILIFSPFIYIVLRIVIKNYENLYKYIFIFGTLFYLVGVGWFMYKEQDFIFPDLLLIYLECLIVPIIFPLG